MSIKSEKKAPGMKVRYLGESDALGLLHGKVYDVVSIDTVWKDYRIIDETDEDYLYSVEVFEVVRETDDEALAQELRPLTKKIRKQNRAQKHD